MFHTAPPLFQWHAENERYLRDRRHLASVAVLYRQRNNDFFGRDDAEERCDAPARGLGQALVRARIPYAMLNADQLGTVDLTRYRAILLANVGALTEQHCQALRAYVADGGGLVATGESSLFDEWGDRRPDFALADVPEPSPKWGDASWTAQSFLQALQRTTRTGPGGQPTSYGINDPGASFAIQYWAGMWKTAWLSDDMKTVTCDSAAMIESCEYLAGLITRQRVMARPNHVQDTFGTTPEKAFLSGKLAMYFTPGTQDTITVAQAAKDHGLPVAYAPIPTFKAFGAAHKYSNNGLVAGAKHPDAGWTLMKWFTDTPNWSISRGNPPAKGEHFGAWAKELYTGWETQVRLDVYRDSTRYVVKVDPLTLLPTFSQMRDSIITPALEKLWAGQGDSANTLREIKAPLQAMVPKDLP
jgi:hypothetical protein